MPLNGVSKKEGNVMILEKFRYPFLGRMRRAEGLPPVIPANFKVRLGTNPQTVFEASVALSLLLVICGFVLFPRTGSGVVQVSYTQELVKIEDVEVTRQLDRPPPPPRPLIPIEAPADEALDDVTIHDTELNLAENVAPAQPMKSSEPEEEYFVAVEEMPEIKGGMESLMKNLIYPELAIRAGLQGTVYIVAFINEKGDVDKVEVLRGIGGGCDEAALEAVKKTKFIPGRQRGQPIKTQVSIPIRFHLTTISSF